MTRGYSGKGVGLIAPGFVKYVCMYVCMYVCCALGLWEHPASKLKHQALLYHFGILR